MITQKSCRVREGPLEPALLLEDLYVSDFLAEFMARKKDYPLSGGRFIMPMLHFTLT